jgi:hypothetical protein
MASMRVTGIRFAFSPEVMEHTTQLIPRATSSFESRGKDTPFYADPFLRDFSRYTQSERILSLLKALHHRPEKGTSPESLHQFAARLKSQEGLEQFIFETLAADRSKAWTLPELNALAERHKETHHWWSESVENPLQAWSDSLRHEIDNQGLQNTFDVSVGAYKGVYSFAKGTIEGIADLFRFALRLTQDEALQTHVVGLARDWAWFSIQLQFGSPEAKRACLQKMAEVTQRLFETVKENVISEWEAAEKENKTDELLAKWTTQGILEVATFVIAALKLSKAAKVSKAAAPVATAEKVLTEAKLLRAPSPLVSKTVKPSKTPKRFKKVPESVRKQGAAELEEWYKAHARLSHSKPLLDSHMKGSLLRTRVRKIALRKGTIVEQWIRIGASPGIYCGRQGADPLKLGIDIRGRILVRFKVEKAMPTMETVVKTFQKGKVTGVGGAGGEIQYIMPPNWESYVRRL